MGIGFLTSIALDCDGGPKQIEHRLGKVDPFFEAHTFAVGEVRHLFTERRGMDKTGTNGQLMGSDMVKGRVHDIVTEELSRRVRGRDIKFDVGEKFYNPGNGQG